MKELSNIKDLKGINLTAEFKSSDTILFLDDGNPFEMWVCSSMLTDDDIWHAIEIKGKPYDINYSRSHEDGHHRIYFYGLYQQEGKETPDTNTNTWHEVMVGRDAYRQNLPLVIREGVTLTCLRPKDSYTVIVDGERDNDSVWVMEGDKRTWIHKHTIFGHAGFDNNSYSINFGATLVSGYLFAYDADLDDALQFRSQRLSTLALYIERNIEELLSTLSDINNITGHVKVAVTKFGTDKVNVSLKDPHGRNLHISINSDPESGIDISYADPNSKEPCPWSRDDSFGVWVDTNSMKPDDDGEVIPRVHLYASQYDEDDEGCPVSFSFVRDSTKRTRFVTRIADDGQHYAS